MDYMILGLLILSPMTGYELQQFIKKNLALICSHSAGSVQTALSKLEKKGSVTSTTIMKGKRCKKVFTITDTGRSAFSVQAGGKTKKYGTPPPFFCRSAKTGGTDFCHSELHKTNGRNQIDSLCYTGSILPYQKTNAAIRN